MSKDTNILGKASMLSQPAPPVLPHILVGTPAYDGRSAICYTWGALDMALRGPGLGFTSEFEFEVGNSMLPMARNTLVAKALARQSGQRPVTHLLLVDSDIGFSAKCVARLLAAGVDIAAGLYPMKARIWPGAAVAAQCDSLAFWAATLGYAGVVDEDQPAELPEGFIRYTRAPPGFMLITVDTLAAMAAAYPELKAEGHGKHHYRFFEFGTGGGGYEAEGFVFCDRVRAIGRYVFADVRSRLLHMGLETFAGDCQLSMQARGATAIQNAASF